MRRYWLPSDARHLIVSGFLRLRDLFPGYNRDSSHHFYPSFRWPVTAN